MNWQEKQREKMSKDFCTGKITAEKYNELITALDSLSDDDERRAAKKSLKYFAVFSILILLIGGASVYYFINRDKTKNPATANVGATHKIVNLFTNMNKMDDADFVGLCSVSPLEQINKALNNGANANARGKGSYEEKTPLMVIANNRHLVPEMTSILINAGADVNAIDTAGYTPLMCAFPSRYVVWRVSDEGILAFVRSLIKAGANVNARNIQGITPLMQAVEHNQSAEVIVELIQSGADVNIKDDEGKTALMYADSDYTTEEVITILQIAERNIPVSIENVRSISPNVTTSPAAFIELCRKGALTQINDALEKGANPNARDRGQTPIMAAAESNSDPGVIKALIDAGANVNAKNVIGRTPLIAAASNNSNPEVITVLIKADANTNDMDAEGKTPLIAAAIDNPNPEVIAALIKAGANVNAANVLERTPLISAAGFNSNPEVTAVLIKAGANVNAKDADGKTPLIMAANNKTIDSRVITDLINAGANVNARDKYGLTPLFLAAGNEKSNSNVITALVGAGAGVNTPDEDGKTPLMEAARSNSYPEVIMTLLQFGANQTLRDDTGKTAIDYARVNTKLRDPEALKRLQSKEFTASGGAKNPSRPVMSDYRFLELCRKGSPKQVGEAISKGANVNAKNSAGMTSLMFAARDNANQEVILTLLKSGANSKAKSNEGKMAIDYAWNNRRIRNTEANRKLEEASR